MPLLDSREGDGVMWCVLVDWLLDSSEWVEVGVGDGGVGGSHVRVREGCDCFYSHVLGNNFIDDDNLRGK